MVREAFEAFYLHIHCTRMSCTTCCQRWRTNGWFWRIHWGDDWIEDQPNLVLEHRTPESRGCEHTKFFDGQHCDLVWSTTPVL